MDSIKKLQMLCKRLPGIGERQAMRIAYFFANVDEQYARDFIESVSSLRKQVKRCSKCFGLSETLHDSICILCADPIRDQSTILIVEKEADRDRFVSSRSYTGMYFILGGLAPAIEKDVDSHIRINECIKRIESDTAITEVVIALSLTPDAERTRSIITDTIASKVERTVTVSFLGRGLSTGTEIEYSDAATLKNALLTRRSD